MSELKTKVTQTKGGGFLIENPFADTIKFTCGDGSIVEVPELSLRLILTVGWAIYPIGYYLGMESWGSDTTNIVYNLADLVNKAAFGLVIWAGAKMDSQDS